MSHSSGASVDGTWIQPKPGDPTPFVVHGEALWRERKEEGAEGKSLRPRANHDVTAEENLGL